MKNLAQGHIARNYCLPGVSALQQQTSLLELEETTVLLNWLGILCPILFPGSCRSLVLVKAKYSCSLIQDLICTRCPFWSLMKAHSLWEKLLGISKILLKERLLGLSGPKRKLKKIESVRWRFKAEPDYLGNLFHPAIEVSIIWNLASLGTAAGVYLFLTAILCYKLLKWGVLCRLSMRNCLFSQALPKKQVCCSVFFFWCDCWLSLLIFRWRPFSPSTPSNLQLVNCEYI